MPARPVLRLLVVMPSWVGDAVMATPALRLLRARLPGIYIGALVRPGIDELLAGSDFFDEVHADRPAGVMGYKNVASRLRARRYDTALLLTNSFSTALIARLAGVPRRIGYNRDARGLLLTDALEAPRRPDGRWAPIPAAAYYWHAARSLLDDSVPRCPDVSLPADIPPMELRTTEAQQASAGELLGRAGLRSKEAFAVFNPGGNNPAKRWPAERFAAVGCWAHQEYGLRILVNGSPGEAELTQRIAAEIQAQRGEGAAVSLAGMGITLGSLKGVLADERCRVMVTNDTGPRHIAAAFERPVVSLFGPTDPRWTKIPRRRPCQRIMEVELVADPELPMSEVADDHPERCAIERIALEDVITGVRIALGEFDSLQPVR
jgi:heptosyltransferase II